jgi:hypothetical protein
MNLINDIKQEWRKNKTTTLFMGAVVVLSLLTYVQPTVTSSIWNYLGITAVNFVIIGTILAFAWWFWLRKRK